MLQALRRWRGLLRGGASAIVEVVYDILRVLLVIWLPIHDHCCVRRPSHCCCLIRLARRVGRQRGAVCRGARGPVGSSIMLGWVRGLRVRLLGARAQQLCIHL